MAITGLLADGSGGRSQFLDQYNRNWSQLEQQWLDEQQRRMSAGAPRGPAYAPGPYTQRYLDAPAPAPSMMPGEPPAIDPRAAAPITAAPQFSGMGNLFSAFGRGMAGLFGAPVSFPGFAGLLGQMAAGRSPSAIGQALLGHMSPAMQQEFNDYSMSLNNAYGNAVANGSMSPSMASFAAVNDLNTAGRLGGVLDMIDRTGQVAAGQAPGLGLAGAFGGNGYGGAPGEQTGDGMGYEW